MPVVLERQVGAQSSATGSQACWAQFDDTTVSHQSIANGGFLSKQTVRSSPMSTKVLAEDEGVEAATRFTWDHTGCKLMPRDRRDHNHSTKKLENGTKELLAVRIS